jgi:hypothetical protein
LDYWTQYIVPLLTPYSQQESKNKHESVTIHVYQGFQLFGVACPFRQPKKTGYSKGPWKFQEEIAHKTERT